MNAIPVDRTYSERSDEELLRAVLRKNQAAFGELLRRYRGLLFRCITRITARYERVLGSEDVEEIFAEVCMALWQDDLRRLRAYDPTRGMKLGSWLGLIASHATYDFLRRLARRPACDDLGVVPEQHADEPSALERLLGRERHDALQGLVDEMSERDQDFFQLYFDAEQDPDEVARDLRISVKTVYSKKNKITTRLLRRAAEAAIAA
jgi:RNA polymerase sigma-70 factor (ECF subfamily)